MPVERTLPPHCPMDQAPTLSHPRTPRSRTPRSQALREAAAFQAEVPDFRSPADQPSGEPIPDASEDPESPRNPVSFTGSPSDQGKSLSDPFAEPIAALLGTALALATLLVPLLVVVTDPPPFPPRPSLSPRPGAAAEIPVRPELGRKWPGR